MDIFDISYKEVNTDNLDRTVKDGQMVTITRTVTFDYNVYISEVLDGTDKTEISLKDLIAGQEVHNTVNALNLEFCDNVDIVDNLIISVEVA